jgi:DNA-binding ferritin-like protein (Dps family)
MDGFKYFNKNKVYKLTDNGCIPFKNVDRYDYRIKPGLCVHQVNKRLRKISEIKEKAILIFSSMGPVYLENTAFNNKDNDRVTGSDMKLITNKDISDHYKIFEEGMRDTLRKLSKKKNLYIIFTLDVPELGIDFGCQIYLKKKITIFGFSIQDMIKPFDNKKCRVPRNIYDKRVKKYKTLVSRVLKDFPDIFFFDPSQYFCDVINCYGHSKIAGYLYSDTDHLSKNGSKYYVEKLFLDLKKSKSIENY